MARDPVSTERLVSDAFAALAGADGVDAQAIQQVLANAAKALAKALPVRDQLYHPDLDGPPMSPEEIKATAVDARFFLELVADLLGGPDDPDWMGDDFAFSVALKRRRDWKPPAEPTAAQSKRRAAAARVYELMAEQCFDTGQRPQQEAAVAAVMVETGLARSKVMLGLKEYRQDCGWPMNIDWGPDGKLRRLTGREAKAKIAQFSRAPCHGSRVVQAKSRCSLSRGSGRVRLGKRTT